MTATRPRRVPASMGTRPVAAALLMLTATCCYAAVALVVRHLSSELHAFEILFFRNVFGLVILAPWLWRILGPGMLRADRIGMHGPRAARNSLSMACWLLAIGLMDRKRVG